MLTMRSPFTCTSVAQPTEQNGQILGTDFAPVMCSSCAWARAGARVAPSPTSPPIAVPAPAPAVARRNSRRLTCMEDVPPLEGIIDTKTGRLRKARGYSEASDDDAAHGDLTCGYIISRRRNRRR